MNKVAMYEEIIINSIFEKEASTAYARFAANLAAKGVRGGSPQIAGTMSRAAANVGKSNMFTPNQIGSAGKALSQSASPYPKVVGPGLVTSPKPGPAASDISALRNLRSSINAPTPLTGRQQRIKELSGRI